MQNSTILKFEDTIGNASKVKHGQLQGKERAKLSNFERFNQKTIKLNQSMASNSLPSDAVNANAAPMSVPPIAMTPEVAPIAPASLAPGAANNDEKIMTKFKNMNVTPIPKEDPKIVAVMDAIRENKGINGINRLRVSEKTVKDNTKQADEVVSRNVPVEMPPVAEENKAPEEVAQPPVEPQMPVNNVEPSLPENQNNEEVATDNLSPTFDFGQTVNLSQLGEEEPKVEAKDEPEISMMSDKEKDAKLDSILNNDNVSEKEVDYDKLNQITEAITEKEALIEEIQAKTRELEKSYAEKQLQVQKQMDEASDYLAELAVKETGATKNYEDLLSKVQKLDALLERKKARQASVNQINDDTSLETEIEDEGKSLAA